MSGKIHLTIITPLRTMFDADVDSVVVKAYDGQMAFMNGHIPLTTTLDYGSIHIVDGEDRKEASVLGGFVEVLDNVVTIITPIAEWPEEIVLTRAEEAKEKAKRLLKQANDKSDTRRAELAFRRATVRIEVSSYTIIKGRGTSN